MILLLALAAALQGAGPVRFHHAHFRAADPSAAIADAAARFNGVRTIVSGLGVGVRVGTTYLLFDRDNDPDAPVALDHVAFATTDLEGVAARLAANGVVFTRGAESVAFESGGMRLEVVRETDAPDLFWCPMHPDVRSSAHGKCPLCAMDLVPIPPPRIGEYKLDVALERAPRGGLSGLRLTVRDPQTNAKVTDFATVHEKTFHLFIVGRDLEYFAHVHPELRANGSFVLRHALPPGEYMLLADFLPNGGSSQMVQRAILSPRPAGSKAPGSARSSSGPAVAAFANRDPAPVVVGGIRFDLEAEEVTPGREACLTFSLTDEKSGTPVTDLEPFLGAPAHMLVVRADLGDAIHGHPAETGSAGPTLSFHPLMPAEGVYKVWIQVQRAGRVVTAPFLLKAGR